MVNVGRILGTKPAPAMPAEDNTTRDTLDRVIDIDPATVYVGEGSPEAPIHFTITFEAPGPMYSGSLVLTIPVGLQPDNTDRLDGFTIGDLDVSPRGGTKILEASIDGDSNPSLSGTDNEDLTIDFDEISVGQKVIITYTRSTAITGTDQFSAVVTRRAATLLQQLKAEWLSQKMVLERWKSRLSLLGGTIRHLSPLRIPQPLTLSMLI